MDIVSGNEISTADKIVISRIFASSFYQWFEYFSKDIDELALAFENSFVLDKFYFIKEINVICGMTACNDGNSSSIKLVKKDLIENLGFVKGNIANIVLKKELEKHTYPFEITKNTMFIEYVAVDSNFRNKGVASKLISHIITNTNCNEFILEVADTNVAAVNLYKKIGFVEFLSIPHKHSKQSGINNMLYMKYIK